MTITVREALERSPLKGAKVLTGDVGLDRTISAVTVMDAPDVINWLKGNEFVITSGYSIKDNPLSLETLISDLARVNAAGLGIKLRRFIDQIPPSIVDLAISLEAPIVVIPFGVSWVEIITSIHQEIMQRQSELIVQGERTFRKFSLSLLQQGGFLEISKVLYELISCPVIILDYQGNSYTQGWELPPQQVEAIARQAIAASDWRNSGYYSLEMEDSTVRFLQLEGFPHELALCPIIVENEVTGYIMALADEEAHKKGPYFAIAIEQAAIMCALRTMITFNTKEVRRRFKNRFAQDLLSWNFRDISFARKQAAFVDWVLHDCYSVLAVAIDDLSGYYLAQGADEAHVQGVLEELYKSVTYIDRVYKLDLIFLENSDSLLILKPQDRRESDKHARDQVLEFAALLQRQVNEDLEDLTVSIGISRLIRDITKLRDGQTQALSALKYGRMLTGGNSVWHYDDLGIYRILCEFDKETELVRYYEDTIAKLEEYDREHKAELVKTLTAYFNNDFSLQKAADELYVHYNTMRYRLERINEITGLDVLNSHDRLNLQVGLKIAQLLKSVHRMGGTA